MQTNAAANVSRLFHLGLTLVGSFEGFTAAPVARIERWRVSTVLALEYGLKGRRVSYEDLTTFGYLALTTACAAAADLGLDPSTGKPVVRRETPSQRRAVLGLFMGTVPVEFIAGSTLKGLVSRGLIAMSENGPARLTPAGEQLAVELGGTASVAA